MSLKLKILFHRNKARLPVISGFNTIIKNNFQYSDAQRPSAQNIITPGGFNLAVTSAALAADNITIPALNGYTNFSTNEKDLSISLLLIKFDPVNADDDYYKIMIFSHTEANYDPSAALEVVVNLDQFHQNELALYNAKDLLIIAATKDANTKIIQYSATNGVEL